MTFEALQGEFIDSNGGNSEDMHAMSNSLLSTPGAGNACAMLVQVLAPLQIEMGATFKHHPGPGEDLV